MVGKSDTTQHHHMMQRWMLNLRLFTGGSLVMCRRGRASRQFRRWRRRIGADLIFRMLTLCAVHDSNSACILSENAFFIGSVIAVCAGNRGGGVHVGDCWLRR